MCRRFVFEIDLGVGAETIETQGQCAAFYEMPLGRGKHAKSRIRAHPMIREVKNANAFKTSEKLSDHGGSC